MRRALRALVLGAVATGALAVAAAAPAAKPAKTVFDLDDPAIEAAFGELLTDACGFAVEADFSGHVILFEFDGRSRGPVTIVVFHTRASFRNVETDATTSILDIGPDVYRIDENGHLILALTGRSITGSGVIGRVVMNLDTGEVLSVAGRPVGDWIENVCADLA